MGKLKNKIDLMAKRMVLEDKIMQELGLYHIWKDKEKLEWLFSAMVYSKTLGDNHIWKVFDLEDGIYFQIENFPTDQFQNMYHIKVIHENGVLTLDPKTKKILKEYMSEEAYMKLESFFNQYRVRLLLMYQEIQEFLKEVSEA